MKVGTQVYDSDRRSTTDILNTIVCLSVIGPPSVHLQKDATEGGEGSPLTPIMLMLKKKYSVE